MLDHKSNCITQWFPTLLNLGINVPETRIFHANKASRMYMMKLAWGEEAEEPKCYRELIDAISGAVKELGSPAFLRSGVTSAKHSYAESCYLRDSDARTIEERVLQIVEFSESVDMIGLPTDVWVVRKFIEGEYDFTAFAHMPVAREFRFFARDGAFLCHHPYWPPDSIIRPMDIDKDITPLSREEMSRRLEHTQRPLQDDEFAHLKAKTVSVTHELMGAWSVDWMYDKENKRWVLIDMALMEMSFHWAGCKNGEK
ncbi:unnamed protein product [marine sediment metagenome]|uniref:ATP-grasp domain-containing protein n=1 Tax=marine sediment metagenome TaxID=412755 RepID=X0SQI7_9ZZZZ